MKSQKLLLAAVALCISLASFSQVDITKKDTTTHKTDTTKNKNPRVTESTTSNNMDQQATITQPVTQPAGTSATIGTTTNSATVNNASSSASTVINATSSTPKPNFGRYYIPVLGSYTAVATSTENKSITVKGDESNPGKIWIEGLTGSKFYALLKAVPGTYKIPAQKPDDNTIAEGTVVYDENSKQINLCVGCGYNDQAPAVTDAAPATETPEATTKGKNDHHLSKTQPKTQSAPIVSFTGTKADQGTVSILQ